MEAEPHKDKYSGREQDLSSSEHKEEITLPFDSEQLSENEREQVVAKGIETMRNVFRDSGLDDRYAVFASTALYLHGIEKGLRDKKESEFDIFRIIPTDFDAIVASETDLAHVRSQLQHITAHAFENNGAFKIFPTDHAALLAGHLDVEITSDAGEIIPVQYSFEIFADSFLFDKNIIKNRTEHVRGMNILSIEALQQQYIKIYEFETRIDTQARNVINTLSRTDVQKILGEYLESLTSNSANRQNHSDEAKAILERLKLTPQEIKDFYNIKKQFDDPTLDDENKRRLEQKMIHIVSGFITKTDQRKEKLESLHSMLSLKK